MTFVGKCFGSISNCFYGTGEWESAPKVPVLPVLPDVLLDTSCMGQEAVVVKNGSRLCGTGAARASTPILQNKAYWEVKIQQSGIWSCGVTPGCDLNKNLGNDTASWAITSEGTVQTNGQVETKIDKRYKKEISLVLPMIMWSFIFI